MIACIPVYMLIGLCVLSAIFSLWFCGLAYRENRKAKKD